MASQLPPHIQQWTIAVLGKEVFEKRVSRGARTNSTYSSSSPDIDDERVRVDNSEHQNREDGNLKNLSYIERYLSSEEDLSPLEEEFDDKSSFHSFDLDDDFDEEDDEGEEEEQNVFHAYSTDQWKAEVAATMVSIIYTGRPKVIDVLPTPTVSPVVSQMPTRDSSLTKSGNNRARARPVIQDKRLARLSAPSRSSSPHSSLERSGSTSETVSTNLRRSSTQSYTNPLANTATHFFSHRPASASNLLNQADPAPAPQTPITPVTPITPITPITPSSESPNSRHGVFKSFSRFAKFKPSKKGRSDSLTSPSLVNIPQSPTGPPPPSSTFAPAPFVRPNATKLVARGAYERNAGLSALSEVLSERRGGRADSEADDEVTDEDGRESLEWDKGIDVFRIRRKPRRF